MGPGRQLRVRRQLGDQHRQRLPRRPAVLAGHLVRPRRRRVRARGAPGHQGRADRRRRARAGRPGQGRLAGLRHAASPRSTPRNVAADAPAAARQSRRQRRAAAPVPNPLDPAPADSPRRRSRSRSPSPRPPRRRSSRWTPRCRDAPHRPPRPRPAAAGTGRRSSRSTHRCRRSAARHPRPRPMRRHRVDAPRPRLGRPSDQPPIGRAPPTGTRSTRTLRPVDRPAGVGTARWRPAARPAAGSAAPALPAPTRRRPLAPDRVRVAPDAGHRRATRPSGASRLLPDGIPHLASPENLPPGSTMDRSRQVQSRARTSATSRSSGTRSRPRRSAARKP